MGYRFTATLAGPLLCVAATTPSASLAWGDLGHQIICEIAYQELDRSARDEVKRLVRLDPKFRYFNESCTWPDHPRKRAPEHFLNVSRDSSAIGSDSCAPATTCLFTGIAADLTVLEADDATDAEKLEALKYLGHWLGDIHQPLHVSFKDDKGGNHIDESGPCEYNLHAVWDTCLITDGIGTDPLKIADELRTTVTAAQRAAWANSLSPVWANESFQITLAAPTKYCTKRQGACWYEPNNKMLDPGEPRRKQAIDQAYVTLNAPKVREQLLKAGVRLGHLLTQALGH